MIIRRDQAAYLGRLNFIQRFRSMLREQFAEAKELPREELDIAVFEALQRAEACGLRTEHSVATFVLASWLLGAGFEKTYPAVEERMCRLDWDDEAKGFWLQSFVLNLVDSLDTQAQEG